MLLKQDGSAWSTAAAPNGRSEGYVQVISSDAIAAVAGIYTSTVLQKDGSVWSTGQISQGQLPVSNRSAPNGRTFSLLQIIPGAKAVAGSAYHSMVLTNEGRVWSTGWNQYGQLGDGSTMDKIKFIRVIARGAKAVAAGDIQSHSFSNGATTHFIVCLRISF